MSKQDLQAEIAGWQYILAKAILNSPNQKIVIDKNNFDIENKEGLGIQIKETETEFVFTVGVEDDTE